MRHVTAISAALVVWAALLFSYAAFANPPGFSPAPLGLDLERNVDAPPGSVILIPDDIPAQPPVHAPGTAPLAGFMLAATVIAAVLRAVTTILRTGAVNSIWSKLPWLAQWATLGVLTAILGALDAYLLGKDWKTALAEAVAGLFGSWTTQKAQKNDRKLTAALSGAPANEVSA